MVCAKQEPNSDTTVDIDGCATRNWASSLSTSSFYTSPEGIEDLGSQGEPSSTFKVWQVINQTRLESMTFLVASKSLYSITCLPLRKTTAFESVKQRKLVKANPLDWRAPLLSAPFSAHNSQSWRCTWETSMRQTERHPLGSQLGQYFLQESHSSRPTHPEEDIAAQTLCCCL